MSEGAFRTAGMVVLAALAAAIVLAAVVLLLRNDDNAPIQILPPSQEPASGQPTLAADDDVRVYISGAVHNPGVYPMLPGDRLSDAVAAAGGPTDDAQLASVNLALRVTDQAHYHIPIVGETLAPQADQPPSWGGLTSPVQVDASTDGLINLNLASQDLLATLPGIGPVLAQAIVDHRDNSGPFRSVEEITDVPRIGPLTYQKLRDLVTVGDVP